MCWFEGAGSQESGLSTTLSEADTETKKTSGSWHRVAWRRYNFTKEVRVSRRTKGKFSAGLVMGTGIRN